MDSVGAPVVVPGYCGGRPPIGRCQAYHGASEVSFAIVPKSSIAPLY